MRSSAFNLSDGGLLISRDLFVSTFLLLAVTAPPFYAQTATPTSPGVAAKTPQVTVVDIMPESLSGETDNDSEPNIAVNPAKPKEIAVSAFTREPMLRADRAPIFVSTDGGNSWSLRSIVPSPQITCDVTLRFGTSSDVLYVSALKNEKDDYVNQELIICQSAEYARTRLMGEVFKDRKFIDQPYIAATTVASKDHVFVGNADFNYSNNPKNPNAQAVIEESLDAAHTGFTPLPIDYRPMTKPGDWSEVRPAIAADGKVVYAAFNRITNVSYQQCGESKELATLTSDVVVVRDDNGGASTKPFSSLVDPKGTPGVVVVGRKLAGNNCLGGDRLADDLALAVHPQKPNMVYLVWSDLVNDGVSLHVKYSTDSGKTWLDGKRDIPNAKNPGLAVNDQGTVGFLYQQVMNTPEGYMWKTQFEQTSDDFKTRSQPLTLAQFPIEPPLYQSCCDNIFLGDYLHLMAVDKDFYGIFSSDNTPDLSHFPHKVKFQRRKNFDTKKLLDLQNHEGVKTSIDPFFFKVTE
jgi:hypothetical protein